MLFVLGSSIKLLPTVNFSLNKYQLVILVNRSEKSHVNHVIMHKFRLFEATSGEGIFKYFLLLQKAVQYTKQLFKTKTLRHSSFRSVRPHLTTLGQTTNHWWSVIGLFRATLLSRIPFVVIFITYKESLSIIITRACIDCPWLVIFDHFDKIS